MTEEKKKNEVAKVGDSIPQNVGFQDTGGFELIQRQATLLSKSDLVPKEFKNNIPNCTIALEMAVRIGASPMAVMQNLYIVHGKPSWSSQFIIAAINSTGNFTPLRFQIEGEGKNKSCFAWATEKGTGETLTGPAVTMEMADKEGWLNKSGSKWKTMPDLMMRYRAATFFGRLYAPEILMGMQTQDEVVDIGDTENKPGGAQDLMKRFKGKEEVPVEEMGEVSVEEAVVEEPEPAEKKEEKPPARQGRHAKKDPVKEDLKKQLREYCDGDMLMMRDLLKEISEGKIEDIDQAAMDDCKKALIKLQDKIMAETPDKEF